MRTWKHSKILRLRTPSEHENGFSGKGDLGRPTNENVAPATPGVTPRLGEFANPLKNAGHGPMYPMWMH